MGTDKTETSVYGLMTETICEEAERLVGGDRQKDYGSPRPSFQKIADLWTAYLRDQLHETVELTTTDVALMMNLMKISRLKTGGLKRDSLVDIVGYTRLVEIMESE